MLTSLKVKGFKSLVDVEVALPRLAVLFGPNAAGKSNLLDAIQALSRIASSRTLSDALSEPIRGYPIEAFSFPPGGLSELLEPGHSPTFMLEAQLTARGEKLAYRIEVGIQPSSGTLSVRDEYLASLKKLGSDAKGHPSIQLVEGYLRIRRKSRPGKPRHENLGQNYAQISDLRLGGAEYRAIQQSRDELSGWRTYYLDPRVAMRAASPPAEVGDIGVLGEAIAPYLFRLKAEAEKSFKAVKRTLRSIIPSIEDVAVELDKRRGTLDILVRQDGTEFSSRIVSEGTLRVLALAAIATNPWRGSLVAFEEPENGVDPRRLELIAELLVSLAEDGPQVVVTTHSPLFCDAVLKLAQARKSSAIGLLRVARRRGRTVIEPFDTDGPLFTDDEVRQALTDSGEDHLFQNLLLRGLVDA